jgi:peptidoglycan/LPS O-acetylase OafA/YrhL
LSLDLDLPMTRDAGTVESGRVRVLDGFRALSIIVVVLSHAKSSPGFPAALAPFLLPGAAGVQVFFVLSGYLITALLLAEESQTGRVNLRHFYLRRAFRILPALFLYTAVLAAYDASRGWQTSRLAYINALTFTTGIFAFPPGAELTQHTWSLSIEEQFYLLWPVLFAHSAMRRRFQAAAVIVLLQPILRTFLYAIHERGFSHSAAGWADAIMWGCAAALLVRQFPDEISRLAAYRPALLRVTAIVVFGGIAKISELGKLGYFTLPFGGTITSVAIAFLIVSYVHGPKGPAARLLVSGPVVRLGVLSYSLYLWQEFFTVIAGHKTDASLVLWRFPVNVVLSVVLAELSYRLVESPMMGLRRRLVASGWRSPAAAPPEAKPRAL